MADFKEWPTTEPDTVDLVPGGPRRPTRIQLQRNGEPIADLRFDGEGRLVDARVRNGEEPVDYSLVVL